VSARAGIGYDSHRFDAGRPLRLGGVTVPHSRGLIGHSDGDVVLHAITDALLGAAALGDIGSLFPDDDPQYQSADSTRFVRGAGWDCGIDAAVLDDFARGLAHDYRATLQRFLALQAQGDAHPRIVQRRLREHLLARGEPDVAALGAGLRLLKETDLRDRLERITQPALILHGERDTLVPLAAGEYLQRALPHAVLEVFSGTAHALFIAQPQRTARRILEFCREP